MEFSVIFQAQLARPTPASERSLFEETVAQAVFAEEMGFDRIWAVEHHGLKWYSHLGAPEVLLAYIAAKTSRIRLGHGVVCLPFNYNHPVRVAERVATLDVLSGGRVDLGGGRGATPHEMSVCEVDPQRTYEEMDESFRIIASAWTGEKLVHDGPLLKIAPTEVLPRPVQQPHPPLFLACSKRDTVRLAADYGVGALVLGFAGPAEIAEMREVYTSALAARDGSSRVSTVLNDHFAALCPTIVLDDAEKAREIGFRGQRFTSESIAHWYAGAPEPNQDTEGEDHIAALARNKERLVAKLHEANVPVRPDEIGTATTVAHAYGTAEHAANYVQQLADLGVDEVMCLVQMGTVEPETCRETLRQWGEKVIPLFR